MKYLSTLLFALALTLAASAQVSSQTFFNELLLPNEGGVFRGYDFETLEDEIMEDEERRSNCTYNYEEIDSLLNMWLGYDLELDNDNYAYIDYYIDLFGIIEIYTDIYPDSDKKAAEIFNLLNKHYTDKFGMGEVQSDGWTWFPGIYNGDEYDVWIILEEDDYGKYVSFDITYYFED